MNESVSPLIQQYLEIKSKYKNELIFFQVGDFYELFFEDAKIAASILSITLTKRGIYKSEHIPLCGIPIHMVEQYYPKLIKKGYTVIICNQTEAAQAGKLVKRSVSDIITPSTIFIDNIYESIYSLFITINSEYITLFWFEFSKQEITYANYKNNTEEIILFNSNFEKYKPKEIITNQESIIELYKLLINKKSIQTINTNFEIDNIYKFMQKNNMPNIFYQTSNIFLSYLNNYFQKILEGNALLVKKENHSKYLFLDKATLKYLECTNNLESGTKENSIYDLLDLTKTKMGSRMLKKFILYPLCNKNEILKRQEYINFFVNNKSIRIKIQEYLSEFGDIEKLFQRIRLSKWRDKDFKTLLDFQKQYILFNKYISSLNNQFLNNFIIFSINNEILNFISNSINENLNLKINDDIIIINPYFNNELQQKYFLLTHQEETIDKFCQNEKAITGINELTIKKSPLYQYVFELSKIKEKKYTIPSSYIRVQTLTQKERYTSIELQKLSNDIINAQEDYKNEEKKIKELLIKNINNDINEIYNFIEITSTLDAYLSLSQCAEEYHWNKPQLKDKGNELKIISGKHPIASKNNILYIANSLFLNNNSKTYLITGPNMGGKSTFMRQNALIILLTHIGSYIPASIETQIPIMEKILTRVGAGDSLNEGKSTFFTELDEIKTILISANEYSFIIIDEIGRGTGTYDGVAIAASTIEYLINKNPYLLCSTHYHELSSILIEQNISWYFMDSIIHKDSITFLYNLIPGKSNNSMGIILAKKIGLPGNVIKKAEDYFNLLQHDRILINNTEYNKQNQKQEYSICIKNLIHAHFNDKTMDDISPKEAYNILEKIYNSLINKF